MTSLPAPTDIVLGPPGTGKTTELLRQVDKVLASGVPPDQIGYYAFTRRAATEAQERARDKFGLGRADLPHFRTIHSECMHQMGIASKQVLDGERLAEFGDWIGEKITGRVSRDGEVMGYERGDRLLFMDNLARVRRRTVRQQYEEDDDGLDLVAVEHFSAGLKQWKATRGLVDYTDMLAMFVRDRRFPRLHTVFLDEAQDLSALQWAAVAALCRNAHRVVVAGDDDQAIYTWAGADPDYLIELQGSATVLGQSYRVPTTVQDLALRLIGRVGRRRTKQWSPRPDPGKVTIVDSLSEVDWSGEVMVLARNQYLLRAAMHELMACGVLYEHRGRPSVRQKILDAVVTWERLRGGRSQLGADVQNMYSFLEVGVGVQRGHKSLPGVQPTDQLAMSDLRDAQGLIASPDIWHRVLTGIPADERAYMIRCRKNGERFSQRPRVRIGTIHDSKGTQRSRVVLLTDMATRTHDEFQQDPDNEHRVFYVAATRAIDELVVVRPQSVRYYDV